MTTVVIVSIFLVVMSAVFIILGREVGRLRRESVKLNAILSSEADETLNIWIASAARDGNYTELCRHFQKHIGELFTVEVKHDSAADKASWSASTHNLLDIYDAMNNITPSPQLRLARMMLKYHSEPDQTPPPPERIIPPYRDKNYDRGS